MLHVLRGVPGDPNTIFLFKNVSYQNNQNCLHVTDEQWTYDKLQNFQILISISQKVIEVKV